MSVIFFDGLTKYHVQNTIIWAGTFFNEWGPTNLQGDVSTVSTDTSSLVPGRFGTDTGLQSQLTAGLVNGGRCVYQQRSFGVNYSRVVGGCWVRPTLGTTYYGIVLSDGLYTPQIGVVVNSSGTLNVLVGGNAKGFPTTVVATSTATVSSGSDHWLEWDITIHNTAGAYQVWLDGTSVIGPVTNVNTRGGTGSNQCNVFGVGHYNSGQGAGTVATGGISGHYYLLNPLDGVYPTARLGDCRVEKLVASADTQKQFNAVSYSMASGGASGFSGGINDAPASWWWATGGTNSYGANALIIRKFQPKTSGVLRWVGLSPQTTAAGANFTAALYADNGSGTAPGALIATGTQVTGITSGVGLILPMPSPAIVAGTIYWIGILYDTTWTTPLSDQSSHAYFISRTYSLGFPSPWSGSLSGLSTFQLATRVENPGDNFACVQNILVSGSEESVQSGAVGAEDLYSTPGIAFVPASVYCARISGWAWKSDANVRNLSIQMSSSGVDGSGTLGSGGAPLLTTANYYTSYFPTDPNTGAQWTAAAINAALIGMKVAV
jgi:hypothetical protein